MERKIGFCRARLGSLYEVNILQILLISKGEKMSTSTGFDIVDMLN